MVYQPLTDESFWAEKGRGAWLQDARLRVSARRDLDDSLIGTGIPHPRPRRRPRSWAKIYAAVGPQVSGIRRFGSAALDLAWVAAGRMDGFWEDDLDIWDTAAGVLLVKEAGGFVTDYRGADRSFERGEYVAGVGAHPLASCRSWSPGRCPVIARWRSLPLPPRPSRRRCVTIHPKHRLVEGVASDGTTIYVSSVLDRQILACRTDLPDDRDPAGGPPPLGRVRLGRDGKRLWVAADCPPGVPGSRHAIAARWSRSTASGKVMTPHARRLPEAFHPGDVSAIPDGVFVSDSQNGAVYRPAAGRLRACRRSIEPGVGKSAQGTALRLTGSELLVADYERGHRPQSTSTTTTTTWLPRQDGKPLRRDRRAGRAAVDAILGIYNGASRRPDAGRIRMRPGGIQRDELVDGLDAHRPDPDCVRRQAPADRFGFGLASASAKAETARRTGAPILAIPMTRTCLPIAAGALR